MRRRAWLIGMLISLLLLSGRSLAGAALVNVGMLTLRNGLLQVESLESATYPFYGVLERSPAVSRAASSLRRAVALCSDNSSARWALGRAALVAGDGQAAAAVLEELLAEAERRPLLYQDALVAFSRSERHEEVVGLYEAASPPESTQAISDTVALAYLEQMSGGTGEQGSKGEECLLNRAKELRPGDLYLNYHLWKRAQEAGDVQAAAAYSETLTHFPLEAVDPTDERLLDYAARVIPTLLQEGIWDREKTLNVVSYLVWQHNRAAGVEQLLEDLTARYPVEPDWPFYQAEMYHRRDELERAEEAYCQVLAVDPEYAEAYLRLGMVAEERGRQGEGEARGEKASLTTAAGWYEQYHQLVPDDILGLKRLAETCTVLENAGVEDENCREVADRLLRNTQYALRDSDSGAASPIALSPAAVLRDILAARTDARRVVAQLLDVSVEEVELGPNLVRNGGFDSLVGRSPENWHWQKFGKGAADCGLFIGGTDSGLRGSDITLRITGIWELVGKSCRAGYWGGNREETLVPNVEYYLSFYYQTEQIYGGAGHLLVRSESEGLLRQIDLPATEGVWRPVQMMLQHTGQTRIDLDRFFLARSVRPGTIRFDGFSLMRVTVEN